MTMPIRPHDADLWIDQVFGSKAAQTGGVVRRSKDWVAREVGFDRFRSEVQFRGFHLIDAGNQFVVICHSAPVRLLF